MTLFRLLSLLMAGVSIALGCLNGIVLPHHKQFGTLLPRHRLAGLLLGIVVLCWGAHDGAAMLPEKCAVFCWLLVPVCAVLCFSGLDFLFARSLGGLLIILPNYLIQHAFGCHCGLRPLYAVICLIFGIAGLIGVAWPWKYRNAMTYMAEHPSAGRRFMLSCIALAVLLAALPFWEDC